MSDSIVAILGMGFIAGVTLTLICLGVSYGVDKDNSKRQHDIDLDMRVYVPSRLRNRSGNNGRLERLETEIEKEAQRLGVKIGEDS